MFEGPCTRAPSVSSFCGFEQSITSARRGASRSRGVPTLGRSRGRVVDRSAGGRQKVHRSIGSKEMDAASRCWNFLIDSAPFLPAFDVGLLLLCLRSWCVRGREGRATRAPHAFHRSTVAASGGGSLLAQLSICFAFINGVSSLRYKPGTFSQEGFWRLRASGFFVRPKQLSYLATVKPRHARTGSVFTALQCHNAGLCSG